MSDEQGSSILYILAPIGAVLVILIAVYFLYQTYFTESQQQAAQPAQNNIPSGWQTYTDTNNGFSFQYPTTFNSQFANFENQTPRALVMPQGNASINTNGCYNPNTGNPFAFSQLSANSMNFCLSQSQDPGAGQLYHEYDYTTLHNNMYVTLQYIVHTPNGCGPYIGTPNEQGCNDFMNNYASLVENLIKQSVASLTFTK